jgi:acetylornithine deacetylase/succinyl-diaminopimelate desuccinylase family protein
MVSNDELVAIEAATDERHDESVEFLREMIRTPSVNPPGEYAAIHDLVTSTYERYGWEVETERVPAERLEALGLDPDYPRPNVLGYVTRGDGPTVALNAHLDTVPVDESRWSYAPFGAEVEDGRIWGRGARDSKGRVAAYTLAARALEESGMVPDDATVVLAITCDEETGGEAGPGYVLESGAIDPDYAVVEGSVDGVGYAAAGVLHPEVTVTGEASHAGVDPSGGVNAVVGAARVVAALEEYGSELTATGSDVPGIGHPTCTPGTIEGGTKTNVVPSSCSITVDRRVIPEESLDDAEAAFREVVEAVELPEGATVDVDVRLRAVPFRSRRDGPLARSLKRNADAVTGGDVPVNGSRGFTDARFFARAGAETAKYGPGDHESNVHGADENLKLDQLRDSAAAIAATLVDLDREG